MSKPEEKKDAPAQEEAPTKEEVAGKEENDAAAKIQALQRGKQGRAKAAAKKAEKEEAPAQTEKEESKASPQRLRNQIEAARTEEKMSAEERNTFLVSECKRLKAKLTKLKALLPADSGFVDSDDEGGPKSAEEEAAEKKAEEEEAKKLPYDTMSPEWQAILAKPAKFEKVSKLADINVAFVDSALRRLYGPTMAKVESIDWNRNDTQGLMSDSAVVKITYAKEETNVKPPTEVFIKAAPENGDGQEQQAFASEQAFYSGVPSSAWSARPTCYFCEGTLVVLDRIGAPSVQLPLFKPVEAATVDNILELLAKVHGEGWPKTPDAPKPFATTGLYPRSMLKGMLPMFVDGPLGNIDAVWEVFAENSEAPDAKDYKRQLAAVRKSDPKSRMANLFEKLWYPKETPETLVFGDVKQDNIFVNDKGAATFIDFGSCAWGPAVADVAIFLLNACSLEDFCENWKKYLKQYHTLLVKSENVQGYTLDQAEKDFKGAIAASQFVIMYFAKRVKDGKEKKKDEETKDSEAVKKSKAQTEKSVLWFLGRWVAVMEKLEINQIVAAIKDNRADPMAQADIKTVEIVADEMELDMPLEEFWKLARDFTLPTLFPEGVDLVAAKDSPPGYQVGARRTIQGPMPVTDELVSHSDEDHAYSWKMVESAYPVENYVTNVKFANAEKDDKKTVMKLDAKFDVAAESAELMEKGLRDWLNMLAGGAKARVDKANKKE